MAVSASNEYTPLFSSSKSRQINEDPDRLKAKTLSIRNVFVSSSSLSVEADRASW